jgi:hypothetical protein
MEHSADALADDRLAARMDDEEQPARHESALAADRRKGWKSIANVALLRVPEAVG